jgi:hypothetical protein
MQDLGIFHAAYTDYEIEIEIQRVAASLTRLQSYGASWKSFKSETNALEVRKDSKGKISLQYSSDPES